jgi:arsenate reductase (thioredoxin)
MQTHSILFICTHNSNRSILAEAITNTHSNGKLIGYSAGSTPSGTINPIAYNLAVEMGYPPEKLRSKSWDEFTTPDAPAVDMVITLCDQAAGEVCPIWPEHPVSAHWGLEDPSRLNGSMDTIQRAFSELVFELKHRITLLASLPIATLDKMTLRDQLHRIHAKQNINPST